MKKILTLILLSMTIFLFSCNNKTNEKKESFISEYSYYYNDENIKDDWNWFNKTEFQDALNLKRVIKLEFSEVKEKIESGEEFVIYYGFNPEFYQCPYCVAALPIAINSFDEIGMDIYYLDIYAMRTNNTLEYLYLLNQLQKDNDFGEKILVPTYVSYANGEVKKYHIATLKDQEGKYIKDLSDSQKEELKQIYQELVK